LADASQRPEKHLLPPLIKDKWKASKESPHPKALVKRVAELRRAELVAYHYAKEFILRWICPLTRREKMAFKCMRFTDLTHNPSSGR
jgi:hypothetical protein